jgi:hypothetical protein
LARATAAGIIIRQPESGDDAMKAIGVLTVLMLLGLTACTDRDGSAEDVGERIDDAADEAADRIEDAADELRDE